ncbi:tyrosine-type recombinase/integrase [Phytohabitans suffuscus]|uniref:Site-specific integrase n=1 Tax=Phytohabitans suffuscus TaxID=624315 RepID=A0A6F8YEB7_9ACTN|nr:tyrosine-type recombinase/integrase [Phytohabitans suffuscus]BCB84465.1 site-specific integrase [Phytohabitans suffuscus]
MARRNANGEGSISKRKDGRYDAALWVTTTSGARKRKHLYGKTRKEAHEKLIAAKVQAANGIPFADKRWSVGEYLTYWLEEVVKATRRLSTYSQYERIIRLYLVPGLGTCPLMGLTVRRFQSFLNSQTAQGVSARNVELMRAVLSSALSRAQHEEIVARNIAKHVKLPGRQKRQIKPWTAEEATRFLDAAASEPLYPAFVAMLLHGLRRGETLGLRWCDVDTVTGALHVRQQLIRVGRRLMEADLKTDASIADLLMGEVDRALLLQHRERQRELRLAAGDQWKGRLDETELVFTTKVGTPIEPRNFARSFERICRQAGVRKIRLHDLRHTNGTLLSALGVPTRDIQARLRHSRASTTMDIYVHPNITAGRATTEQVASLLARSGNERSRQSWPSISINETNITTSISGGVGGARTPDLVNVNSVRQGVRQRVASVRAAMERHTRQWLLGVVAVNLAVKNQEASWSA